MIDLDVSIIKRFIKSSALLARLNLEQNPVLCDLTDGGFELKNNELKSPISLLPQSTTSIESYLNFLSNITQLFILLRQTVEQYQIEPFDIINSIHNQCQQYYEQKVIEPIVIEALKTPETSVLTPDELNIVRLQAHWRRQLIERRLCQQHRAAQVIQTYWRGFAVRQRMHKVRRMYSQQQPQIYDEIDLTEFEFDEVNFSPKQKKNE